MIGCLLACMFWIFDEIMLEFETIRYKNLFLHLFEIPSKDLNKG
jgi:hypothetical protein